MVTCSYAIVAGIVYTQEFYSMHNYSALLLHEIQGDNCDAVSTRRWQDYHPYCTIAS